MDTRICAVCGKKKSAAEFGDGIRVPKTTCLDCYQTTFKTPKTTLHLADLVKKVIEEEKQK